MEKKLPKVFANKVDKEIGNNKNVFYSAVGDTTDFDNANNADNADIREFADRAKENLVKPKNIYQKINDIFNSSRYVYKADVEITFKDGTVFKRIVGKNANHLITIDNELIPISEIIDIRHK